MCFMYVIYETNILLTIAVINKLKYYIYKEGKVPKYIDEFNKKINKIKLVV